MAGTFEVPHKLPVSNEPELLLLSLLLALRIFSKCLRLALNCAFVIMWIRDGIRHNEALEMLGEGLSRSYARTC